MLRSLHSIRRNNVRRMNIFRKNSEVDRPVKKTNYKLTLYSSYIGYITQAVVNSFAPLLFLTFQSEFGIPLEQITLLVTVNFSVQLIVDLLSMKLIDKIGYKPCIIAANVFSAAGLICLCSLPYMLPYAYAGILISVFIYAIGGGLLEVLVSPIVEACPFENKSGIMSMLHSFYCWGCVLVALISSGYFALFGISSWRFLAAAWALVPIANMVMFALSPIPKLVPEGKGLSLKELLCTKSVWIFFILMLCAGAAEQSMSQWASAFVEAGLGLSKTYSDLAGPCMFSLLMGASRALYGKFSEKLPLKSCMILSCLLCIISYLLATLTGSSVFGLIGCGLCGFSVGILWPGVFSLCSKEVPRGGTAMFAMMALGGDLGCDSGPTIVGFISDASGSMNAGLLSGIVFPVILIAGLFLLGKIKDKP